MIYDVRGTMYDVDGAAGLNDFKLTTHQSTSDTTHTT